MQGEKATMKPLDYYPTVEDIFRELAWQSNTKISIPAKSKEINQPIEEPLTNQEKEEDYELHLHISTFMFNDIPAEDTSRLQLTIVPQPIQTRSAPTEHQVAKPTEKSIIPTHQWEEGEEKIEEYIEPDNPEYAMTKQNLRKTTKEISASRKKKEIQEKGKRKRRILLSDSKYE